MVNKATKIAHSLGTDQQEVEQLEQVTFLAWGSFAWNTTVQLGPGHQRSSGWDTT